MIKNLKKISIFTIALFLSLFYLISHLYKLIELPIFADEAIYIKWSQLFISEPLKYVFFPINDGKTPLFIWLIAPFIKIINDPLYAARFFNVLIGLSQMLIMPSLIGHLGGKKLSKILSMLLVCILPFWFFHHRMALMDALVTLNLSISLLFFLKVNFKSKLKPNLSYITLSSIFFSLALYSKFSAILFLPGLLLFSMIKIDSLNLKILKKILIKLIYFSIVLLCCFCLITIYPSYKQLFTRGGDFLIPLSDLIKIKTITNIPKNIVEYSWFVAYYLSWPLLLLLISIKWIASNQKKKYSFLLLTALLYCLPIFILGKTVYPRYFLPVALPITLIISLLIENIYLNHRTNKKYRAIILISLIYTTIFSFKFMITSYCDISQIPFLEIDKQQYLYKWSSGIGIPETVEYLKSLSKNQKIIVATEGYFGTLPDGLQIYFYDQKKYNIIIDGIGQPIKGIRKEFIDLIKKNNDYDQVLLIANNHRMLFENEKINLLKSYCRPNKAPCLQIYDITTYIKSVLK